VIVVKRTRAAISVSDESNDACEGEQPQVRESSRVDEALDRLNERSHAHASAPAARRVLAGDA
jgi:hypothetical protein